MGIFLIIIGYIVGLLIALPLIGYITRLKDEYNLSVGAHVLLLLGSFALLLFILVSAFILIAS